MRERVCVHEREGEGESVCERQREITISFIPCVFNSSTQVFKVLNVLALEMSYTMIAAAAPL